MRRVPSTLLTLGALALAVSACGGDDPAAPPGDTLSAGEAFSVRGALAELPESAVGERPMVLVGDLVRATELLGTDRPEDAAGASEWLSSLTGVPRGNGEAPGVFVPLPQLLHQTSPEEMQDLAGWSALDVDSFAAVEEAPTSFVVVSGGFGDDALDGLPEVGDGVVTDVEADDHAFDPQADALSRIGAPTRMAQDGDRIVASSVTALAEEWLGGVESLADDDRYAGLADALDDREVYSAVLLPSAEATPNLLGAAPESAVEEFEKSLDALPDAPFDLVAVGWHDGDSDATIGYRFGSEEDAEASVEALEELYASGTSTSTGQPYSELVEAVEVSTDGPVVLVDVEVEDGRVSLLFQMLTQSELLFASR